MTQPLLQTRDLHRRYRMGGEDVHVLRGVDMTVHEGEWLAILGASGSGKSTLLHLLGGLDQPSQGGVSFRGQQVWTQSAARINDYRHRHVGFVFQFYHLLPELTALENVLISSMVSLSPLGWLGVRSKQRQRALQLLEQLGLSHRLKHRPNRMSGGERQRVAIARALINQPALLLADEPTGNLDAQIGAQILEVFQQVHRQGQTIVMVTHDQRIADAADRVVRLESGRVCVSEPAA